MPDKNEKPPKFTSRIPGFYQLNVGERQKVFSDLLLFSAKERSLLIEKCGLEAELLDTFIENSVGTFSLPLGIATNFIINNKEYLVPMAVEESSVIAAASHAAKIVRENGGFKASSCTSIMTGQLQIILSLDQLNSVDIYIESILKNKSSILELADEAHPKLRERGHGARDVSCYLQKEISSLILLLDVDTGDAMGANIINTMLEYITPKILDIVPGTKGLCILTNLPLKRLAKASCEISPDALGTKDIPGHIACEKIRDAYLFAKYDIYRAATHNKGIMNGIDPVVIATGNDWRAIEAGAHSFACREGRYQALGKWEITKEGKLYGELELPMAIGTVGGMTRLHPMAQLALKILRTASAKELAEVITSIGLAQNLAALKSLSTEGIQKGHMQLHQKNLDLMETMNKKKKDPE